MNLVLKELLNSHEALSGEIIGQRLHISRAAVWKQINKIKESGIVIKSVKRKGYLIESLPAERLIPEWIRLKLNKEIKLDVIYVSELDSTNTYAKKLVLDGKNGDFLVITDKQRAGRGRMGRVWESGVGKDLTFSLVIESEERIHRFYYYTMLMSLSLQMVLEKYGDGFRIKWPNDIYWNDKKIAGLLSEMLTEADSIRSIIIGVGLNVNSSPKVENAISLSDILKNNVDRHKLIVEIINTFYDNFIRYIKYGENDLFEEWKHRIAWIGQRVTLTNGKEIINGVLKGLEKDGSLVLSTDKGIRKFYTGDLSPSLRLS